MRRRLAAVLLCVVAGALPSGCGNRRTGPPDLASPQPPRKLARYKFPKERLRFSAPRNWSQSPGAPPLVAVVVSGQATVAIWRYPRRERLPTTQEELKNARAQLIDVARTRDRTLAIQLSRLVTVGGAPGVQLLADETIAGQARRVRSTHIFDQGAEYVVDASAPANVFAAVDRTVFAPLLASVRAGRVPHRRT